MHFHKEPEYIRYFAKIAIELTSLFLETVEELLKQLGIFKLFNLKYLLSSDKVRKLRSNFPYEL